MTDNPYKIAKVKIKEYYGIVLERFAEGMLNAQVPKSPYSSSEFDTKITDTYHKVCAIGKMFSDMERMDRHVSGNGSRPVQSVKILFTNIIDVEADINDWLSRANSAVPQSVSVCPYGEGDELMATIYYMLPSTDRE
jgi:hypothetical protein